MQKVNIEMKTLKYIAVILLIAVLYSVASTSDWAQEVIQTMSEAEYEEAVAALGDTASDYEIARYYVEEMKP